MRQERSWRHFLQAQTYHWYVGALTALAGFLATVGAVWPAAPDAASGACGLEGTEACEIVSLAGWAQLSEDPAQLFSFIGLLALNFLVCLVFGIVGSHPVMGPVAKIRRHIKALIAGDYEHTVGFRKGDRLKDMAADLNDLTDQLKAFAKRTRELEQEVLTLKRPSR